MKKKIILLVVTVAVQLCLCSCANIMSERFKPDSPSNKKALVSSIQIYKTAEARPLKGRSKIGRGALAFIPFYPFANQRLTPERYIKKISNRYHSFLEDVSKTVRKDIKASGITRSTSLLSVEQAKFPLPANSYALCLRLHEGIWSRNLTNYGISIGAAALYIAGAPLSYGDVILELEATIYNTEGKCLGTKRWHETIKLIEWMYSPHNKVDRRLVIMYKRISPKLRRFVSSSIKKELLNKKNNAGSKETVIDISNTKDRWLSLDEISKHLGVNERTILEYINKRKMPAYRIGKQWKFKQDKVDAWIEAGGSNVNNK